MCAALVRFLKEETGALAIEYGLITTLVSIACAAAFEAIGDSLIVILQTADDSIASATH